MSTFVFTLAWRQSSRFCHIRPIKHATSNVLSTKTSSVTGSIFEQIPKEELAPKTRPRVRDREFLPGSTGDGFPEFLAEPSDSFPVGMRVNIGDKSSLLELGANCMEYIKKNLAYSQAILFRGLPAETAEDFLTLTQGMRGKPLNYEGGATPRPKELKNSDIYFATTEPGAYTIELHNEMAYLKTFPRKVLFFCQKEPGESCGGETPLAKCSDIVSKLDPEVVKKFDVKGVMYVRYLPDKSRSDYMPWQHQFYTDDRKAAERGAQQQGYTVKWDDNGDMYLAYSAPAFLSHPVTGEKIWFNQITTHHCTYSKALPQYKGSDLPDEKYPHHTYYGDGSDIEPEVLQHIRAVSWSCATGFRWKKGDLIALNNLNVQHGRMAFTGERKILVHMTTD